MYVSATLYISLICSLHFFRFIYFFFFLISCCGDAVLMVQLGLSTKTHLIRVRKKRHEIHVSVKTVLRSAFKYPVVSCLQS